MKNLFYVGLMMLLVCSLNACSKRNIEGTWQNDDSTIIITSESIDLDGFVTEYTIIYDKLYVGPPEDDHLFFYKKEDNVLYLHTSDTNVVEKGIKYYKAD